MFSSIESGSREQEEQSPLDQLREERTQCEAKIFELEEASRDDGKDRHMEIAVEKKRRDQIVDQMEKLIRE